MRIWTAIIGFLGLILLLYGLISAIFYSNINWYIYFVIGGFLFLGYINYKLKNESIFGRIKKDLNAVLKTYLLYFIAGVSIDVTGKFFLYLWHYPYYSPVYQMFQLPFIIYPVGFFFLYESFVLTRSQVKSFGLALIIATLVNCFLNEIPNTFIWTWKYTIPYIKFEILEINIIVIIGWVILIFVPLFVKKILK